MTSAGLRRISVLFLLILCACFYWLWRQSKKDHYVLPPDLMYKVRAYTPLKRDAERVMALGRQSGYKGQILKTGRTIKKLMGYEVVQDFKLSRGSPHTSYIMEFLSSKGFRPIIVQNNGELYRIRVNGFYPNEKDALNLADEILQKTKVSFEVRKHVRETPYKAFSVVFDGITQKKDARKLKDDISVITSDVEMVVY